MPLGDTACATVTPVTSSVLGTQLSVVAVPVTQSGLRPRLHLPVPGCVPSLISAYPPTCKTTNKSALSLPSCQRKAERHPCCLHLNMPETLPGYLNSLSFAVQTLRPIFSNGVFVGLLSPLEQ